jgi:hypothetical protein
LEVARLFALIMKPLTTLVGSGVGKRDRKEKVKEVRKLWMMW